MIPNTDNCPTPHTVTAPNRDQPAPEQPAVQAPVGPLGLTRALTPVLDHCQPLWGCSVSFVFQSKSMAERQAVGLINALPLRLAGTSPVNVGRGCNPGLTSIDLTYRSGLFVSSPVPSAAVPCRPGWSCTGGE